MKDVKSQYILVAYLNNSSNVISFERLPKLEKLDGLVKYSIGITALLIWNLT